MTEYVIKKCTRTYPKIKIPIRLDDQCIKVIIHQYKTISERIDDNRRDVNEIRNYLHDSIPLICASQLVTQAVEICTASEALNLLNLFCPEDFIKEKLNLVAANSFEFGVRLQAPPGRFLNAVRGPELMWCGSNPDSMLNVFELGKLYHILLRFQSSKMKKISLAVESYQHLQESSLINIFTRTCSLTQLTILGGADDVLLGTIGKHCTSLTFLDVSHSTRVRDKGLQKLFIRQPATSPTQNTVSLNRATIVQHSFNTTESNLLNCEHFNKMIASERTQCASKLHTIVLTQTNVSFKGLHFVCRVMNTGYLLELFPSFTKVFRITNMTKIELSEVSQTTRELVTSCLRNVTFSTDQTGRIEEIFRRLDGVHLLLCHIELKISCLCKINGNQITTMVLQHGAMINVCMLGRQFPCLKYFFGKFEIEEELTQDHSEYLMPRLEVVNSHLCQKSSVIPFLLRFAPALKSLRVLYIEEYTGHENILKLNDVSLAKCLLTRHPQDWNLEDFVIVKGGNLTIITLKLLLMWCPKLKRIGDMDSWSDIGQGCIDNINEHLDSTNSQCVLSVLTNPMTMREQEFYNSAMSFMEI